MSTLVLLTSQIRQGAISADFDFPGSPAEEIVTHLDLSPQDMTDPVVQLAARPLVSRDAGSTWEQQGAGTWVGRDSTEKNGRAREWRLILNDGARYANLPGRLELELPNAARIAVRLTV